MAYLMVCNVEIQPAPGEPCPPEFIQYYQNFWDSGLTLEQTGELIALVALMWAIAYVFAKVKALL